jgi:hypothetical protein
VGGTRAKSLCGFDPDTTGKIYTARHVDNEKKWHLENERFVAVHGDRLRRTKHPNRPLTDLVNWITLADELRFVANPTFVLPILRTESDTNDYRVHTFR